jgi:phospholipid/cholesterol/gamma-HCH transport system ATP-binding protein
MASDPNIIEIKGLRKSFGENHVLRGIDLEIPARRLTTIIGKSGEGKSVLLKCIAGLLDVDAGAIQINVEGAGQGRNGHRHRQYISYLFQNNALFDSMTAFENVALPLRERTRTQESAIADKVNDLFAKLDLHEVADRYPGQLSGGMQKRVALARALVFDPQIVLFDEPTAGLDPLRKNAVFEMIGRYQKSFGFTAVLVSHDLPDVLFFSDRIAALHEGRIAFYGAPIEFEQSELGFAERFLHSRDYLKHNIIGLSSEDDLERDLQEKFAPEKRILMEFRVQNYDDMAEDLGEVACHLIMGEILKILRGLEEFPGEAYSGGKNVFLLPVRLSSEGSRALMKKAREQLSADLHPFLVGLNSNRCASFAIEASLLAVEGAQSAGALASRTHFSREVVFDFHCKNF